MDKVSELRDPDRFFFQQDGASPHYTTEVKSFLDRVFVNQWIGRGVTLSNSIAWPARSPDITPLDFFLWGYVKNLTYAQKPENLFELQQAIVNSFEEVSVEMCRKACQSVERRLNVCINRRGLHVK